MTTAHESYPGDFKVTLDIDTMDEDLYDALLSAFRAEIKRRGLEPEGVDLYLDRWEVSCTAFRCDPDANEDTL